MLIPSPTMVKQVIVRDTLADGFLASQTLAPYKYDGVKHRDGGYDSFGAYYSLWTEYHKDNGVNLTHMSGIEGGWQRLVFTFPDRSCAVVYADYGYKARPNKFGGMIFPTAQELLPCLDIPS